MLIDALQNVRGAFLRGHGTDSLWWITSDHFKGVQVASRRSKTTRSVDWKKPQILATDRQELAYAKNCTISVQQILKELSKHTRQERRMICELLPYLESQ